jgi:hypothetical protein
MGGYRRSSAVEVSELAGQTVSTLLSGDGERLLARRTPVITLC